METYGIVSYNMHCNFTNYGSALQTYALYRVVNSLAPQRVRAIVLDYCPDVLRDKDVRNPMRHMWDKDEHSRRLCELTLPAILENADKFDRFYQEQYTISAGKYTSANFNDSLEAEGLAGYVCGSDTIWCTLEFNGFDDGYFAQYPAMRNSHTVSYAASFGDAVFEGVDEATLIERLQNYKAIGVRETTRLDFIRSHCHVPVERVLDPTLLLTGADYAAITAEPQMQEPYILLYARRYNAAMERYADKLAAERGCKVVEISLRATNADRHIMRYDAGVEEFLSLVKHAECVVTNSFHGAIFSAQMHREFMLFSREQCDTKIDELLSWLGLTDRKMVTGEEHVPATTDYEAVEARLAPLRAHSLQYLETALDIS